jgi:hypothetical protein
MTVEQHQHRTAREILTAPQGFVAGLVAGMAMAAVAMAGFALAGRGLWTPINAIGEFFGGSGQVSPGFAGGTSFLGLGIQLVMGGILGALYASAQERIDVPSLLFIAVYYGFVIWIVATFLVTSWLKPWFHDILRAWPMVVGHLVFGSVLGFFAVARLRHAEPVVVSPD